MCAIPQLVSAPLSPFWVRISLYTTLILPLAYLNRRRWNEDRRKRSDTTTDQLYRRRPYDETRKKTPTLRVKN